MATARQAADHQRAQRQVEALALRDLNAFWAGLDVANAVAAKAALIEFVAVLTETYGAISSTIAADFYDSLREDADARGSFRAAPSGRPNLDQVASSTGWAAQPLFGGDADSRLALSRISGAASRFVLDAGRETMFDNILLDPEPVRYARHASANACAFCALLATRGAVFLSKESATRVVGRGTEKRHDGTRQDSLRKGIRARGKQALGEKYHDFCHCVDVAVFPGQEYAEAPYVAEWRDAYAGTSSMNPKQVLSEMRESLGTK